MWATGAAGGGTRGVSVAVYSRVCDACRPLEQRMGGGTRVFSVAAYSRVCDACRLCRGLEQLAVVGGGSVPSAASSAIPSTGDVGQNKKWSPFTQITQPWI